MEIDRRGWMWIIDVGRVSLFPGVRVDTVLYIWNAMHICGLSDSSAQITLADIVMLLRVISMVQKKC